MTMEEIEPMADHRHLRPPGRCGITWTATGHTDETPQPLAGCETKRRHRRPHGVHGTSRDDYRENTGPPGALTDNQVIRSEFNREKLAQSQDVTAIDIPASTWSPSTRRQVETAGSPGSTTQ